MRLFVKLFVLLSVLYSCEQSVKSREQDKEEKLVQFRDLDGTPVDLASFKGKRVLVNYWAVWCIPCRAEFPSLVSAQEKLKEDDYVFLFPSPDDADQIMEFQKKKNYPFRYLTLEGSLESRNINVLPSTIIYSSTGEEFKRVSGVYDWDSEETINHLKQVP